MSQFDHADESLQSVAHEDDVLARLPGGIEIREFAIAGQTIRLAVPSEPDAVLESATVTDQLRGDAYWSVVWPVSVRMATLLAEKSWRAEDRFLELGCGTGLVGVTLAKLGHRVEITDVSPEAVALAARSCRLNDVPGTRCRQLDWTAPNAESADVSVIVAADVLYSESTAKAVLSFLRANLRPQATAWIGDPGRQTTEKLLAEIGSRDAMQIEIFDDHHEERQDLRIGQFNLLRFTRRHAGSPT